MQQAASKVVPMAAPRTVHRAPNSAADTFWSDIATHLTSIDYVASGLRQNYAMSDAAAEACGVLQNMVANMRKLQEIQRHRYSHQADDGIATIASEYIPAVLKRVEWPRNSVRWQESIELSALRIATVARLRQAANKEVNRAND